jgi:hypothetical protein
MKLEVFLVEGPRLHANGRGGGGAGSVNGEEGRGGFVCKSLLSGWGRLRCDE